MLVFGFLIFATGLFLFVQYTLNNNPIDGQRLSELDDLYPPTIFRRIVFIIMTFWAGVVIATIPFIFQHGIKWGEHFWWFAIWGIVFGVIFVLSKRLLPGIIIHFLVGLSAVLAVLQVLEAQ